VPPYRAHVALIYNVTGQTLEWYPPADEVLRFGAPAAATYSVWRGESSLDETPLFTGTATLDSVSQTTQNIAGPTADDRSLVQVASGTGVTIGRRYLLTNAASNGGQRMIIVPRLVAGAFINHETDIGTTFTLPCTFQGLRQSFTIDASFIATLANINIYGSLLNRYSSWDSGDTKTEAPPYRVRWSYVLDSATRHAWTTFDVCRFPLKHNVTVDSIKGRLPDAVLMEWQQQRGSDFQPQIEEAFDSVKFDIRLAGYDADMIQDPQIIDRLVMLKTIAILTEALEKARSEKDEQAYQRAFEKSIGVVLKAWVSTDSSGAINPAPVPQLWLTR
jgi:hypothetical protein